MSKEVLFIGGGRREFTLLAEQFREAGGTPVMVRDGNEAKQRLAERIPSLAVVAGEQLSDPWDLVREMVFLYRGLPILGVAVKGSVHEAREAITAGCADYLLLPVEQSLVEGLLDRFGATTFDPTLGRGRRMITADPSMEKLLSQIRRAARSKATVLILGESGTGKELIARYIHQVSDRANGHFIAVNCAALPENLLESELFGHARGAFTGAVAERKGKFLQAHGGTILLDEVSEMTLNLQAKLLRVLQEGEVDPVGGRGAVSVDVRVIAASNRNLKSWVTEQRFREDLFYRLNVFPVHLPPLRERRNDIVLLAEHFRKRFVGELGRNDIPFSRDALAVLAAYGWPGNVRELENVVQRALLVAEGREIVRDDLMIEVDLPLTLPPPPPPSMAPPLVETPWEPRPYHPGISAPSPYSPVFAAPPPSSASSSAPMDMPVGTTIGQMEELLIRRTLDEVAGNRTRAAELLGISIRTLRNKLNEYAARLPEG